jgi:hypothetical protein
LFDLCTKFPAEAVRHRKGLVRYVLDGSLRALQLDAAVAFFKKVRADDFEVAQFEKECGIGVYIHLLYPLLTVAYLVLKVFSPRTVTLWPPLKRA